MYVISMYQRKVYKPSLTLPRFQVIVPTKKVSGHVFCARGINFAYMILIFDFEIASIVWYLFFILFLAGLKLYCLRKVCIKQIFNSDVLMVQPTANDVCIMINRISFTT
jgi:hypothetical protein